MSLLRSFLVALIVSGTILPMHSAAQDEVTVTILINSGEANPSFTLKKDEVQKLLGAKVAKLSKQAPSSSDSALRNHSGYRGMIIEGLDGAIPGVSTIQLYHSELDLIGSGENSSSVKRDIAIDASSEIERVLLDEGVKRGLAPAKLKDFVEQDRALKRSSGKPQR